MNSRLLILFMLFSCLSTCGCESEGGGASDDDTQAGDDDDDNDAGDDDWCGY